jgi:multidrug efflux pump subunit AcrA (membrane-fusion protein)
VTATGKVVSIDPNPTTSNSVVSYGAVVRLASVPKTVRLGQSADVVITTAEAKNVVAVPTLAITTLGDRSIVRVVKDGVVTPTEVETGIASTSYTEITSGLTAGESVELDLSSSSSTTGTTTGGGTGRTGGTGRDGGGFSVGG